MGLPSEGATRGRTFVVPITKFPVPTFLVATCSIWSAMMSVELLNLSSLKSGIWMAWLQLPVRSPFTSLTTMSRRQRFPVHRRIFGSLRQQFHRHIDLHRVFKGLYDLARERRHAPEDIDGAALYSVLVLESDVAVLDLNRDGNQHRVTGNLQEVRPHIEGHQVDGDLMPDHF